MNKKEYIIPQMVVVRLTSPSCLMSTSTITGPGKDGSEESEHDGAGNGEGYWDY